MPLQQWCKELKRAICAIKSKYTIYTQINNLTPHGLLNQYRMQLSAPIISALIVQLLPSNNSENVICNAASLELLLIVEKRNTMKN
ncbi:hypothetical protein T10_9489 [Trichinella papuae]|uniref:Uncharacterized protein n=1 Tax=Trichinella papuae TaxID=268474 RepID=A0A0V1N9N3_9BILA|nr:hypothetical protein T10_9489 [Trichinella papuae]